MAKTGARSYSDFFNGKSNTPEDDTDTEQSPASRKPKYGVPENGNGNPVRRMPGRKSAVGADTKAEARAEAIRRRLKSGRRG
jgi:hypothetical protein